MISLGGLVGDEPGQGKSVEAGRRVRLPQAAERPIEVFINGSRQAEGEGEDYMLRGKEILFSRPLMKEEVSRGRWLAMALGLFGSYGRHDAVDVHFRLRGEVKVISNAEILP